MVNKGFESVVSIDLYNDYIFIMLNIVIVFVLLSVIKDVNRKREGRCIFIRIKMYYSDYSWYVEYVMYVYIYLCMYMYIGSGYCCCVG